MKKLHVLAPSDRFNYGDLLFPFMLKYCLEDKYDSIDYYSTTRSDLSRIKSLPTKGPDDLNNMDEEDENVLIVAGGESFLAGWGSISSFVKPYMGVIAKSMALRLIKKISIPFAHSLYNYIGRKSVVGKTMFPFCIGAHEIAGLNRVYYNSLGGCNVPDFLIGSEKTKKILHSVSCISVRDKYTHEICNKHGINSKLVPDSAIIMSDVFSEDFFDENVSDSVRKFAKSEEYVYFQINKELGLKHIECIVKKLEAVHEQTGKLICLCPIGLALRHEDNFALKKIYDKLSCPKKYFSSPNLFDIMYLIANSGIYIGSSLHGMITAMSFEKPYLGLLIPKLKCYLETWETNYDMTFTNDISQVDTHVNAILERDLEHKEQNLVHLQDLKAKVYDSINKMK